MARVVSKNVSNLISVDWEAGAEPPFQQAIANARVVSLEIIEFMNVLKVNHESQNEIIARLIPLIIPAKFRSGI